MLGGGYPETLAESGSPSGWPHGAAATGGGVGVGGAWRGDGGCSRRDLAAGELAVASCMFAGPFLVSTEDRVVPFVPNLVRWCLHVEVHDCLGVSYVKTMLGSMPVPTAMAPSCVIFLLGGVVQELLATMLCFDLRVKTQPVSGWAMAASMTSLPC